MSIALTDASEGVEEKERRGKHAFTWTSVIRLTGTSTPLTIVHCTATWEKGGEFQGTLLTSPNPHHTNTYASSFPYSFSPKSTNHTTAQQFYNYGLACTFR